MKILVSLLVFAITLFLSYQTLANEHAAAEGHSNAAEAKEEALAHKMNSLFPKPQMNKDLATAPAKAELLEPAFMAKVTGTEATLKWKEVEGADSYHLQVSQEPTFTNKVWLKVDENPFKGNSYTIKGLEAGKHYYWRVAAYRLGNKAGSHKGWYAKSMFETK